MKRALLTIIASLLVLGSAQARENTLFDAGPYQWGWFGGPTVNYTRFNHTDGLLVGGQGALLVSHLVYLGGGGCGLTTRANAPSKMINSTWQNMHYDLGYGGGLVGVIIKNDNVFHLAADVLIGGGDVVWTQRDTWEDDGDRPGDQHDAFFFVQPAMHLEMNITHWMRVDAGAGYRFVNGITLNDLNNNNVGGPVAGLTFRFGQF